MFNVRCSFWTFVHNEQKHTETLSCPFALSPLPGTRRLCKKACKSWCDHAASALALAQAGTGTGKPQPLGSRQTDRQRDCS